MGELGWELYAPFEQGLRLWDILWEAGEPFGLIAAGGGAFDSLRLEKGYRLWGQDIHTEYNPIRRRPRIRRAHEQRRLRRPRCTDKVTHAGQRAPTLLHDPRQPRRRRHGQRAIMIMDADRILGYVTSANYGHTIGRGIVYGYLPIQYTKVGTSVDILYFGERLPATVAREPLYDPRGTRMKA